MTFLGSRDHDPFGAGVAGHDRTVVSRHGRLAIGGQGVALAGEQPLKFQLFLKGFVATLHLDGENVFVLEGVKSLLESLDAANFSVPSPNNYVLRLELGIVLPPPAVTFVILAPSGTSSRRTFRLGKVVNLATTSTTGTRATCRFEVWTHKMPSGVSLDMYISMASLVIR